MQRLVLATVGVLAVVGAQPAHAQVTNPPVWKCMRGDRTACTRADLANAAYRQVLVVPTGFTAQDSELFWGDFDTLVATVSNTGAVWSTQYRARILYVGYFVGGGALGAPDATFGGAVAPHPIRGYALSLSNDQVYAAVDGIKATEIPELRPMAVEVVFNDTSAGIKPNASPPSFTDRSYGIAKLNRDGVGDGYIGTHELAHAALNFLDEYVEQGFEDISINALDVASMDLVPDGSWSGFMNAISNLFGVYDFNISEILGNNGNDNIATSSTPSTVVSPNGTQTLYPYEGGMFFGRGTFHAAGNNLMNDNSVNKAADNGFDYAHSPSQQMMIATAFGGAPYRANDRLRNAGPKNGWPLALGSTTHVMLFDGDKRNEFHPTQQYTVQVGWYERRWKTCWSGFIPYPCYDDVWRVAQKTVKPAPRSMQLQASSLVGLANLTQDVLCGIGATEFKQSDRTTFQTCDASSQSVPTYTFETPYQDVDVPANQWFTTYYWRFATYNGTSTSGYTGWSRFYRSF